MGYYRLISVRDEGEERTYYGQFHVVLREVEGIWKIAQDWDAGQLNGREIGEADFLKNKKKGFLD